MLLGQTELIPDPTQIIDATSGRSDLVFILCVVAILWAAYKSAEFVWIRKPRDAVERKKIESDMACQRKLTDGFDSLAKTTGEQQRTQESVVQCLESIQETLDQVRADHYITHAGMRQMFQAWKQACRVFSPHAKTDVERDALHQLQEAVDEALDHLKD